MDPGLVAAEGGIGGAGPAGAQTEEGGSGPRGGGRIVTIATHHDFRPRPVVRQEEDQGIVQCVHAPDLVEHSANLAIHAIYHRRMDGHLRRLEFVLLVGPRLPIDGPMDLAGPSFSNASGKR